jgi:hypothetical protein
MEFKTYEQDRVTHHLKELYNGTSKEALTIKGGFRFNDFHVDCFTALLVSDYELIDHGIDAAQYFQGCGTAFSKFDHCFTGCGQTSGEALDDALEQLAMESFDADQIESMINADYPTLRRDIDAHSECNWSENEEPTEEHEGCELYYYISIRVKE